MPMQKGGMPETGVVQASGPCYRAGMFAVALGLAAAFFWSAHDLIARVTAGRAGPFRLAFWAMLLGAGLLLVPVLWRGQLWHAPSSAIWTSLALGVAYAAAMGGLFKAYSLAPVSIVGPFTASYPALVVVWGLLHGLAPTPLQWTGLGLCLAGTVLVGRGGPQDGGMAAIAPGKTGVVILSAAVASLGFAASIVLGQQATVEMGEFETTFLSRFPAALALLIPAMHDARQLPPISRQSWLWLLAIAAADVLAVSAVNATGYFPGKEFGAMGISMYGAITVIAARFLLKESVAALQWLGIAMIVGGVALLGLPA